MLARITFSGKDYEPVLSGHALNTGTNTNVNHASLDSIGNIHAGHETTAALSVQALDTSVSGEASGESSSTEFGGTTAWGEDGADGNILNELWVDPGALDESFECTDKQLRGHGVFKLALSSLADSGSESTCYDDLLLRLG